MIEVEKKFILTEESKTFLIEGAEFINERVFTDIYYDNEDFSLTTKDIWLRAREGKWELKIPLQNLGDRVADQYEEIQDENEIRKVLKISESGDFPLVLEKSGYLPFCVCKTTRRKYKKESFTIDLDTVEFKDFNYNIAEIELMVNDKSEVGEAVKRILDFAKNKNLTNVPVRGKVVEYLKRVKPNHYQALVEARVVNDF